MSYAMRKSTKRKIRATMKKNHALKKKLLDVPVDTKNTASETTPMLGQAMDMGRLQERAYHRGMIAALEAIIRELR